MNNAITFKKVDAGNYKLLLNGVEMAQYERGYKTWCIVAFSGTNAYREVLNSMDYKFKWLIDSDGHYLTKAEIKKCWESAIKFMNQNA